MTANEVRELARQERNRYSREWRAKNKDRVRETNRKYWERRAAKLAASERGEDHAAADEDDL